MDSNDLSCVWRSGRHSTTGAGLVAAGTPHRIEWHPAVEHGFVFPLRTGIYNQPAAERHWERLFSLFARNLGRPATAA